MVAMGEMFDTAAEMVTAPNGHRWMIETRRPRHAKSEWDVVIAPLVGVAKHRERLAADCDPSARVTALARLVESGGWPD
jgi:hypothetical protein